ncbi:mRNA 3'-end-processing protein yth1 [Alternaria alternata]|nr:mRNA 3'-end-processing protein yth1 [Alternaria alternata]
MHTSDKHVKDPYRFLSEHWLGEKSYEADKTTMHQPFSYGSRDYTGKRSDRPCRMLVGSDLGGMALPTLRCNSSPPNPSTVLTPSSGQGRQSLVSRITALTVEPNWAVSIQSTKTPFAPPFQRVQRELRFSRTRYR